MQKFIKKSSILIFVVSFIMSLIVAFSHFIVGSQYENLYPASLIDKVNRLKNIDEPKIILVGNSNVAFGICSERIEEALGMPVVNLGLHGDLGNAYHEQIAKLNINEGDIVVVCHCSFSDEDKIVDNQLAWVTYDYHEELWPIIRVKDYPGMLSAYPTYIIDSFLLWLTGQGNIAPEGCYSREAFNEYGDVNYKPEYNQMNVDDFFRQYNLEIPKINNVCIDRLNELNQYCINQGATLVVAGYPIAYGEYSEYTERDFIDFQEELKKELDCDVISDYTDYFFPYRYFYDTAFHLNEEGTEVRTNQLISDLNMWMNESAE